jgi:16S rRNA (cytidine1402-2'-O)-methyltransferase
MTSPNPGAGRNPIPKPGTLVLMPNALDLGMDGGAEGPLLDEVLSAGVLRRAAALTHWVVEDARSARAFIKRVGALLPLAMPLQAQHIVELPRPQKGRPASPPAGPTQRPGQPSRHPQPSSHSHAPANPWSELLQPALQGHDIGLLSEAGLPAVADPGAALVAAAHEAGVPVLALAGPSSITLAVAASGLQGQSFAFVGYLPQDAAARTARIKELEALSRRANQTQLCIETPYRNAVLLEALLTALAPATRLAIAVGLTLPGGWSRTATVAQWRASKPALPDRVPAVFSLLA